MLHRPLRPVVALIVSLGIHEHVSAQTAPAIEWQYNYGGSMPDAAHSITPTSDGGYILAGRTDSNDGDVSGHFGQRDIWVVKLRTDGTLEWERCFGGSQGEHNISVIHQTADGGYILGGTTYSFDGDVACTEPPASRIWVAKLGLSGQIEWQRCLGGTGYDFFASITSGTDGYVLCGYTYSTDGDALGNHGLMDLILVKLSLDGSTAWSRCYGGSNSDVGRHVIASDEGGYLVTGQTQSNDGDLTGINLLPVFTVTGWVLKVNGEGEILWQRCVGGSSEDYLFCVREAPDGSLWAVGYTNSNDGDVSGNQGSYDGWVVRLDASGNLIGNRCLGGGGYDRFWDLQVLPSGSVVAVGQTNSMDGDITDPLGSVDVWAASLSSDLELLWQRTLGGSANDLGEGITSASDGGVVVVGFSQSADGDLTSNNGYGDLWVVKLQPWDDTGFENIDAPTIPLFPNPTTSNLHIQWSGPAPRTLEVLDSTGRLVYGPVVPGHVGEAGYSLPVGALPAGLYALRVQSAMGISVQRFVKE